MRILSVNPVNYDNYKKLSLNRAQIAASPAVGASQNITFSGKTNGIKNLLSKVLPKRYDHDFLPKTFDEAIEYIGKIRGVQYYPQMHETKDYKWVTAYKPQRTGFNKDVHEYLFVNNGQALIQSTSYNAQGKELKHVVLREDGTLDTVRHYVDGRLRNDETYRNDGTLSNIAKYDEKSNFLGFQKFDETGTKEIGFQYPERHSGDIF